MDKEMIQRHLALAEGHIADGRRHIDGQRTLTRQLEKDGHDTTVATRLLATLEAVQDMHLATRARLEQELAACERPAGTGHNPMPGSR